jgi:DNA-binding protein Fis
MKKRKDADRIDKFFLTVDVGKVYGKVIADTEKELIIKALKRSFGNQSIAAKLLGINRNTLRSKIEKLNIDVERYKI